jgi:outer membrane cobalamin receptor
MSTRIGTTVILGVFLFGNTLVAQRTTNTAPCILVTASPITQGESVGKDGGTVSVVGRDQIERLDAKELPSALRQVPGVTISRYNLLGSYGGESGGSVYIRGAGAGRPGSEIKVFSDGAPRESGVWSHPVMDMVPVDFAHSISVFKGPQPQAFSGTFGAVNIETLRRFTPGYETEVNFGYGSYDTLVSSLASGGKIDGLDYYAGAAHKASSGSRPHGNANLDNQFLRLGADISDKDHISYILQLTDNWSRDPGRIDATTPILDLFATKTMTHVVRLDDNHEYLQGFSLLYYDDGQIRWAKDHLNGPGTPSGSSDTDWNNYGFRSSYDVPIDQVTLTGSLDLQSTGGESKNVTTSGLVPFSFEDRFTTFSPYLGVRYALDIRGVTVTPSAGARYYQNNEFNSETAPCAALTMEKNGVQVFVSQARGVNYPGVYAKGISTSTMDQMEAEVIDNTEAGVHWELSKLVSLQASVFHYEGDNRLQYTPNGLLNVGEIKTDGAETTLHLHPCTDVTLFAGLTYLHPDAETTPRMPEFSTSAGISYQATRHVKIDLDAEYVDDQYAYNGRSGKPSTQDLEKVDGYLVASARVVLSLAAVSSLHGEFYVSAENITDEDYEYLPGYPMSGTTYFSGLKLKF